MSTKITYTEFLEKGALIATVYTLIYLAFTAIPIP
jgi:hypothetical protein